MKKTVKNFEKTIIEEYKSWKEELEYQKTEYKKYKYKDDEIKKEILNDIDRATDRIDLLRTLMMKLEIEIPGEEE